jgi:hypothetical protein
VLAKDAETMRQPTYDDHWNPMSPPGWAANGSRWNRSDDPYDIAFFEVIK